MGFEGLHAVHHYLQLLDTGGLVFLLAGGVLVQDAKPLARGAPRHSTHRKAFKDCDLHVVNAGLAVVEAEGLAGIGVVIHGGAGKVGLDASGEPARAAIETREGGIRGIVDNCGARYPAGKAEEGVKRHRYFQPSCGFIS